MSGRTKVAVLISGRGSNMGALIEAAKDPAFPGEIALVLSNKADAAGLQTARANGIEARAIEGKAYPTREAHEAEMAAAIESSGAEFVCLAGYMRLLTPGFVQRFAGRMINIHPSLLPLFPGLHTHERALAAGMRIHGCTVHFVTEAMDEGPIVAQAAIAIRPDDTAESLGRRLLAAEHRLYPHALRLVLEAGAGERAAGLLIEA